MLELSFAIKKEAEENPYAHTRAGNNAAQHLSVSPTQWHNNGVINMANGGYNLHRREDPDTSRAAAQAILAQLPALQQAVYAYALMKGIHGFTDEEMMTWFMSHSSTYRSRRSELTRAGLIVDSGRRRLLPTRRNAIIWAITPPEYIK